MSISIHSSVYTKNSRIYTIQMFILKLKLNNLFSSVYLKLIERYSFDVQTNFFSVLLEIQRNMCKYWVNCENIISFWLPPFFTLTMYLKKTAATNRNTHPTIFVYIEK